MSTLESFVKFEKVDKSYDGEVLVVTDLNLNIQKGDKTVLQPDVTFHMIAVMQFGDWGVEASESIRVTEKGSELFCSLSRELHVK